METRSILWSRDFYTTTLHNNTLVPYAIGSSYSSHSNSCPKKVDLFETVVSRHTKLLIHKIWYLLSPDLSGGYADNWKRHPSSLRMIFCSNPTCEADTDGTLQHQKSNYKLIQYEGLMVYM